MSDTNWVVDPSHSYIEYTIFINGKAPFKVYFRRMAGVVTLNEQFEKSQMSLQWVLDSLDTGDKGLDKFLTSADFFSSDKISILKFASEGISKLSETQFAIKGMIHSGDKSEEVSFNCRYDGNVVDMEDGKRKTGLYMATQVYPKMFNINNREINFDKSIGIEVELELVEKMVSAQESL